MPRKMFKVQDKVQIQKWLFVLALKLGGHNRLCVQNSFTELKVPDHSRTF